MKKTVGTIILLCGLVLLSLGLLINIPGEVLTTYEYLDNEKTDYYVRGNKYSSIDEYVGGDAYNYIIGATLVGSRISGSIAAKSIYISSGIICICLGIKEIADNKNQEEIINHIKSIDGKVQKDTELETKNEIDEALKF